jgi:2-oxoglutarate dehydrogenase E1 component
MPKKVKRVIACSGKVYYDLLRKRGASARRDDVASSARRAALPVPAQGLRGRAEAYPNATEIVWCQDEPQNQGAWFYVQHYVLENMPTARSSATPAAAVGLAGGRLLRQAPSSRRRCSTQAFGKLKGFVLNK